MRSKRITRVAFLILLASGLSIIPINSAFAAACAPSQTTSGNYIYLSFVSSSQSTTTVCDWKIPAGVSQLDLFMVGGGGAGGNRHAGGGGAGGLFETNNLSVLNVDTLTITIGKGGTGQGDIANNPGTGPNGDTTTITKASGTGSFTTLNAIGGGGGTSGGGSKALSGGSGGGAYDLSAGCGSVCYGSGLQPTSATGGSGNNGAGGNGGNSSIWTAGGGGGALTAGVAGTNSGGGNGGSGDFWNTDFTTTIAAALGLDTSTARVSGGNIYFAGGGGGGRTFNSTRSSGGLGGGGNGGANDGTLATASAANAISNTGSGGGGSGIYGGNSGLAGSGAAGIVLIRFLRTSTASVSLAAGDLIYRTAKNVTASASSAGKIDFQANGKSIAGCRNIKVSAPSYSATCSYRPSVKSRVTITAKFTPTDSAYFAATAVSNTFNVIPRSGNR